MAVFQTSAMTNNDNLAFAKRLKLALTRHSKKIDNATELALQFNLRHVNEPITSQAAYKWLTGKAKPTTDKIQTLAAWLNVPEHWLNFGSPNDDDEQFISALRQDNSHSEVHAAISDEELKLLFKLRKLSEHQKQIIDVLLDQITFQNDVPH